MVETESHNREHKSGMARIWAAAIGPWLRLRRKIAEVGPLYAAQLLFEQLVPQFLFRINMFVMIEGDPNKRGPSSDRDPEIRWTSLPELGALSAPERAMEDLRIGLENGERGAIFERGGALIGYILYATDAVDEGDWMRFRLAPEDIWNSVAWVAPGHRGQGIHASLRNFAVAGLLGEGYTRILANIDALNRNSLSATWKVGAWDIGRFFFRPNPRFHVRPRARADESRLVGSAPPARDSDRTLLPADFAALTPAADELDSSASGKRDRAPEPMRG